MMQVPQVSRVLVGMAGSSILGRTWSCLRVEQSIGGGGAATSGIVLDQVPCEHIAGPLANREEKKCCLLESKWKIKYDLLRN